MTDELKTALHDAVTEIMTSRLYYTLEPDGSLQGEIFADYRDQVDDRTAGEILTSNDPEAEFYDKLCGWYQDYEDDLWGEANKEVKKRIALDESFAAYDFDEIEEEIDSFMQERVYFTLPTTHYLDQEFDVNIMLDTGDGNYDYVLNSVYPCWYGREGDPIDDKAGIVWLARQQGYTKTQLKKALKNGEDMAAPHGFLESMYVELINLPSHMSTVTFLTKMTLRQLIRVNEAIRWRDKRGTVYDARLHPQCGYIVLGKETMCGLYDPWAGGGSILEVELEKDVKIPIKFIRCALPDDCRLHHEYSIGSVYGLCSGAWKDTVREIHIPKNVRCGYEAS